MQRLAAQPGAGPRLQRCACGAAPGTPCKCRRRAEETATLGRRSAELSSSLLQRYRVPFKPSADCQEVVDWINTSGPYAGVSGAAYTKTPLKYDTGALEVTGEAPDFTVTCPNLTVTYKRVPPDMPQWSPSDPKVKAAWGAAMADLRAHEGEHEKKGAEYETTVQRQMRMVSIDVSAGNKEEAKRKAQPKIAEAFKEWIDDLQKSHEAIDPYEAQITCPAKEEESS